MFKTTMAVAVALLLAHVAQAADANAEPSPSGGRSAAVAAPATAHRPSPASDRATPSDRSPGAPFSSSTLEDDDGPLYKNYDGWEGGGAGGCHYNPQDCITTCLFRVECSCWYVCPSGGTWVVKPGYCPNTIYSCPS